MKLIVTFLIVTLTYTAAIPLSIRDKLPSRSDITDGISTKAAEVAVKAQYGLEGLLSEIISSLLRILNGAGISCSTVSRTIASDVGFCIGYTAAVFTDQMVKLHGQHAFELTLKLVNTLNGYAREEAKEILRPYAPALSTISPRIKELLNNLGLIEIDTMNNVANPGITYKAVNGAITTVVNLQGVYNGEISPVDVGKKVVYHASKQTTNLAYNAAAGIVNKGKQTANNMALSAVNGTIRILDGAYNMVQSNNSDESANNISATADDKTTNQIVQDVYNMVNGTGSAPFNIVSNSAIVDDLTEIPSNSGIRSKVANVTYNAASGIANKGKETAKNMALSAVNSTIKILDSANNKVQPNYAINGEDAGNVSDTLEDTTNIAHKRVIVVKDAVQTTYNSIQDLPTVESEAAQTTVVNTGIVNKGKEFANYMALSAVSGTIGVLDSVYKKFTGNTMPIAA